MSATDQLAVQETKRNNLKDVNDQSIVTVKNASLAKTPPRADRLFHHPRIFPHDPMSPYSSRYADTPKATKDVPSELNAKATSDDVSHKRSSSEITPGFTIISRDLQSKQPRSGSGYVAFSEAVALCSKEDSGEALYVARTYRLTTEEPYSLNDTCNDGIRKEFPSKKGSPILNDIRRELHLNLKPGTQPFAKYLPDPKDHVSPEEFLQKLVKVMCNGLELQTKTARSMDGFFSKVTDQQIEAYTTTVVSVVRNNDVEGLKELRGKGQTLNCLNRFGESLLHMACRRGFEEMVDYLMDQPDVNTRICDDCGRTVLHDACWNPSPQLRICRRILQQEPMLFFIADNRGCSAFQYARPEHWKIWRYFLWNNREALTALNHPEVREWLVAKGP